MGKASAANLCKLKMCLLAGAMRKASGPYLRGVRCNAGANRSRNWNAATFGLPASFRYASGIKVFLPARPKVHDSTRTLLLPGERNGAQDLSRLQSVQPPSIDDRLGWTGRSGSDVSFSQSSRATSRAARADLPRGSEEAPRLLTAVPPNAILRATVVAIRGSSPRSRRGRRLKCLEISGRIDSGSYAAASRSAWPFSWRSRRSRNSPRSLLHRLHSLLQHLLMHQTATPVAARSLRSGCRTTGPTPVFCRACCIWSERLSLRPTRHCCPSWMPASIL